jgi:hypothetical protein
MTTKDFIKMLQEADPSGEAHIRMEGGIPVYAELKAGYWDGPYSYIDDEGNYVYSSNGSKVDLYCRDIEGFVEHNFDFFDPDGWEKIKNKFKFDLTYSIESQRKEREDSILKTAKEAWDMHYEMEERFFEEEKKISLERAASGWTWFQNKLVDDSSIKLNMHHYYTWKVYNENGKEEGSSVYNTQGVYKSGLFDRLDNNKMPGYYEWVLKK